MKILVTCDWFSPCTGGGAERVAYEVARRLAEGHSVTVVAARPAGQACFDAPGLDLRSVAAVDLSPLVRAQVSVAPLLPAAIARAVRSVAPDVVWAHSLQFQSTVFAALIARSARIPFVVTAHIGDLRAVAGPVGVAARMHEATIGRTILRLANRAIAVSEPVADHIRALEPGIPVDVVPNGVDLTRFSPHEPADENLRIGFLGRLVPNKGADVAIRALALAVASGLRATMSVAGDGPERSRLEALAVQLGVDALVRFVGFQDAPEIWMREIDVLVRPSTTEGMPLAALEAMAAGVVVVASDVPGNAALLRHGELGLLVPLRDVSALSDALGRLSLDRELRRSLRARSLVAARAQSWDRTTELTLASLQAATVEARVAGQAVPPTRPGRGQCSESE
jgi:glycosyltransferase involved in cell wall biosynthesis